jgi:hypothetical protein
MARMGDFRSMPQFQQDDNDDDDDSYW